MRPEPTNTILMSVLNPNPYMAWEKTEGNPHIYNGHVQCPHHTETFKVEAYVDDVKPGITSLAEFEFVDRGSAIFEAASVCILHRDPSKG